MASIVTGLNRMTDVQVIQFAKQIQTALTGNANVPAPNPPLSTLQTLIATAEGSIDAYEAEKAILRNKKNMTGRGHEGFVQWAATGSRYGASFDRR